MQLHKANLEESTKKLLSLKNETDLQLSENLETQLVKMESEIGTLQKEIESRRGSDIDSVRIVTTDLDDAKESLMKVVEGLSFLKKPPMASPPSASPPPSMIPPVSAPTTSSPVEAPISSLPAPDQTHSLRLPHEFDGLTYFKVNYLTLLAAVLALSLLSHPFSLLTIVSLLAAWLFLYLFRSSDQPVVFFGRTFSDREILGILSLLSMVLLEYRRISSSIVKKLLDRGLFSMLGGSGTSAAAVAGLV